MSFRLHKRLQGLGTAEEVTSAGCSGPSKLGCGQLGGQYAGVSTSDGRARMLVRRVAAQCSPQREQGMLQDK